MKAICERRDARWLPSRHRFALFRLYAWLRLRRAKPELDPGVLFMVDRDQTQYEYYSVSLWMLLTLSCFLAAWCFPEWPIAAALLASLPLASVVVQAGLVLTGLTIGPLWQALRGREELNHANVVSFVLAAGFFAAAAYHSMARTWVRWVAWQVFVLVALNAVASAVVFLLREPIERLERTYEETGGAPSAS